MPVIGATMRQQITSSGSIRQGQKRRLTPQIKRELRRRAAIEPVIGIFHLKAEHRMGRNHFAHHAGDAANAVLAAAGYNFHLLLKWLEVSCFKFLASSRSSSRPSMGLKIENFDGRLPIWHSHRPRPDRQPPTPRPTTRSTPTAATSTKVEEVEPVRPGRADVLLSWLQGRRQLRAKWVRWQKPVGLQLLAFVARHLLAHATSVQSRHHGYRFLARGRRDGTLESQAARCKANALSVSNAVAAAVAGALKTNP